MTVNPHTWSGWEEVKSPADWEIPELDGELLKKPDASLDFFTDVDGVQHIRAYNLFSGVDGGLWETYSRQGEEFPLELLMNDTNDF